MESCQSDTHIPSFRPKPGAVLPVQLQHHSVKGNSRNGNGSITGNGNWRQRHHTVTPTHSQFQIKVRVLCY